MKYLITSLVLTALSLFPLHAQRNYLNPEVGVVEKLDSTIFMDAVFVNENGETVRVGDLIDKPTVITPVYFDCPSICSPLLDGVAEAIEKAQLELGTDYQVLTVSFNFRDSPEAAKDKKANFLRKIDEEQAKHWIYLTSDSSNIFAFLNSIGYKVKPAGLDFIHPAAILVVSPEGKITRYLYGLTYLPFDFKMAVIEASKGLSRPTINRVLEFCFSYDPAGQRYALEVTKIAGILIILIALIMLAVLIRKPKRKAA